MFLLETSRVMFDIVCYNSIFSVSDNSLSQTAECRGSPGVWFLLTTLLSLIEQETLHENNSTVTNMIMFSSLHMVFCTKAKFQDILLLGTYLTNNLYNFVEVIWCWTHFYGSSFLDHWLIWFLFKKKNASVFLGIKLLHVNVAVG